MVAGLVACWVLTVLMGVPAVEASVAGNYAHIRDETAIVPLPFVIGFTCTWHRPGPTGTHRALHVWLPGREWVVYSSSSFEGWSCPW